MGFPQKKALNHHEGVKHMIRKIFIPTEEQVKLSMKSIYDGHQRVMYRGIKAIRCPFDYVIYQMIIFEFKPDLVIEIGTNAGGGALYLADLMSIIDHGLVHTIDITNKCAGIVAAHPRIRLFNEGWQNYDLKEVEGFSKILIIEDGSHQYEETLAAMKRFAPLVTVGSYMIVEDGIVNKLGMEKEYGGGPLKAIREFLRSNKDFKAERYWCDLFGKNATFNVNGYLKRMR
jgi:cephalosporin hydroxylase